MWQSWTEKFHCVVWAHHWVQDAKGGAHIYVLRKNHKLISDASMKHVWVPPLVEAQHYSTKCVKLGQVFGIHSGIIFDFCPGLATTYKTSSGLANYFLSVTNVITWVGASITTVSSKYQTQQYPWYMWHRIYCTGLQILRKGRTMTHEPQIIRCYGGMLLRNIFLFSHFLRLILKS